MFLSKRGLNILSYRKPPWPFDSPAPIPVTAMYFCPEFCFTATIALSLFIFFSSESGNAVEFIKHKPFTLFGNNLAKDNKLYTYKHHGFWMPMDTLRDKNKLNNMWSNNTASWKNWK